MQVNFARAELGAKVLHILFAAPCSRLEQVGSMAPGVSYRVQADEPRVVEVQDGNCAPTVVRSCHQIFP